MSNIYVENGYDGRMGYLECLEEDFDGLIVALEDNQLFD